MKDKQEDSGFREAGPYLTLSYQMVFTMLIGIAIGWYIDEAYNTKPLYFIIFSVLFTIIALANFIRTVIMLGKEQEKRDKQNDK